MSFGTRPCRTCLEDRLFVADKDGYPVCHRCGSRYNRQAPEDASDGMHRPPPMSWDVRPRDVRAEVSRHLELLGGLFPPHCGLTFIMRNPKVPDGMMIITNDDLVDLRDAINRQIVTAGHWLCPECDMLVVADEDGCCVCCGADCEEIG